jgi:hypothetical protein
LDVDGCEDYDNQRACEYDPCQLNSCNWNGNSCVPTTGTQCPGTDASCGTYPNCAACGSGKKCINNACQNIQCGEGQITSACYCQGTARTNGYCCSNVYQTTACTTPYYLVNIDFENGNNGSWTNYNPGNGTPTWQIVNDSGNGGTNALSLGGALNPVPNQTIPGAYRILNGTEAENFTLEAKIRSTSTATWRDLDIIFGYQNEQNQCNAIFNGGCDQVTNGIIKVTSGTKEKIGTQCTTGTLTDQQWHNVKIVKEGDNIQAYYDNMATPIFTATTAECGLGSFGFGSINDTGLIDDIKITSQDTAECVNGTALASYLSQWKAGNTTMPTMMQKIALWKSGAGC